ncbi:hypothetical protein PT2222_90297 [Paraburkholderia tropica]
MTNDAGQRDAPRSERRIREIELFGVLLRDQHRRNDRRGRQRLAREPRLGRELDRVVDELRRIRHVGLNQRIAVHHALDHVLRARTAEHDLDVAAFGLIDRLEHAHGHVVVGGPDGVDVLEARQEVLHGLEGVVAIPVRVLRVENLHVRIVLQHRRKGVPALVVERGRNAAQRDDVALAVQLLREILGGNAAERGVVAGHVGVLRALVGQAAIDHRHVHALLLDLRDRLRERGRFKREDHQRVDLVDGHKVLQLVRLIGRVGRRLDDDFQVRMRLLQLFLRLVGPPDDAAREAVIGRGNGDAERDLVLGVRRACRERRSEHRRHAERQRARPHRTNRILHDAVSDDCCAGAHARPLTTPCTDY